MRSKKNTATTKPAKTKVQEACDKLGKAVKDLKDNGGTKTDVKIKALELISTLCKDVG